MPLSKNNNPMEPLALKNIPDGYKYYRSAFASHRDYRLSRSNQVSSIPVKNGFFWWKFPIIHGVFALYYFLKCPNSPPKKQLQEKEGGHGIIFWAPWWETPHDMNGWIRLPKWLSRGFHHASRSSFSVLEWPEYYQSWAPSARNHRRKILQYREQKTIEIRSCSAKEWLETYKKTRLPHDNKSYFIRRLEFLEEHFSKNLRIYMAYKDTIPLAGWVFLDEWETSVYLFAFQDEIGKPYHLGLGIIDYWFLDSYQKWFKYLDFDHMWNIWDPKSYKGYTKFKSELANYELLFEDIWVQWF